MKPASPSPDRTTPRPRGKKFKVVPHADLDDVIPEIITVDAFAHAAVEAARAYGAPRQASADQQLALQRMHVLVDACAKAAITLLSRALGRSRPPS
jgi:hypothetical protein